MFSFCKDAPDFWVQLKGDGAGQPLRHPSANCVGIKVDRQVLVPAYLFYTFIYLQSAGKFKAELKGSVIPFIRQRDIVKVFLMHLLSNYSSLGAPEAVTNPQGSGVPYAQNV